MDGTFRTSESQNRFLGLFVEQDSISSSLLLLLTAAPQCENMAWFSQEGEASACPEHLQEGLVCWGLQGGQKS